jgi:aromatic ring-opening dioxygenase LigB subunit
MDLLLEWGAFGPDDISKVVEEKIAREQKIKGHFKHTTQKPLEKKYNTSKNLYEKMHPREAETDVEQMRKSNTGIKATTPYNHA